jgi:hypothetical protein
MTKPTIGRIVLYRTDGRNGLEYDLPAIVTCTAETHPGDYPDGRNNPLPVPTDGVHLTVFTPGGFGSVVHGMAGEEPRTEDWVGAPNFTPGSGTYVEWDVPEASDPENPEPRTWRWPTRA